MDALINKFGILLNKHHAILKPIYYSPSNFFTHRTNFQKELENNTRVFRMMKFPFSGLVLLRKANSIFENIPELVCSIIELGLNELLLLEKTLEFDSTKQVLLSKDTLYESSPIFNKTLELINVFKYSPETHRDLENQIRDNLELLKIDRAHTDLSGCLQVIYEHFYTYIDDPYTQQYSRNKEYLIPLKKERFIEELVKPYVNPLYRIDDLIVLTVKEGKDKVKSSLKQAKKSTKDEKGRFKIALTPIPGTEKDNEITINGIKYTEVANRFFDFLFYLFWLYTRYPKIAAKIDFEGTIPQEHINEMTGNDDTYDRFDYGWNRITSINIKHDKTGAVSYLNNLLRKEHKLDFDVIATINESYVLTKKFHPDNIDIILYNETRINNLT